MSCPTNTQATHSSDYYELQRKNCLLDANISRIQDEIRCIRQSNSKSERIMQKKKKAIFKLNEEIHECKVRQNRVTMSLSGLQNVKNVLEKEQHKESDQMIEMKVKSKKMEAERKAIVKKYDERRAEHLETYKQLRVYKTREAMRTEVERNVIALNQVRHEFESHQKKFKLLNSISGQKMEKVIIGFSFLMVSRTNLRKKIHALTESNKKLIFDVEELSKKEPQRRSEIIQTKVYQAKDFEAPSSMFTPMRERFNFGSSFSTSRALEDMLKRFRSPKTNENSENVESLPISKRLKFSEPNVKDNSFVPDQGMTLRSDATAKSAPEAPRPSTPVTQDESANVSLVRSVSSGAKFVHLPKKTIENTAKVSLARTVSSTARLVHLPKTTANPFKIDKLQSQEDIFNQTQRASEKQIIQYKKDSFLKKTVNFSMPTRVPTDDSSSVSSSSAYQEPLSHQKPESPKSECSSLNLPAENMAGPSDLFTSGFSNPCATSTPANEDFGAFFGAQSSQKYSNSSFFNLF